MKMQGKKQSALISADIEKNVNEKKIILSIFDDNENFVPQKFWNDITDSITHNDWMYVRITSP